MLPGRAAVFGASLAGIAMSVAFGLSGYNQKGFPSRLAQASTPFFDAVQASFDEGPSYHEPCTFDIDIPETYAEFCVVFAPDGADREIAVIGDSHQAALLPAFEDVATQNNVRVLSAAVAGCPPLLGTRYSVSEALPVSSEVCYEVVQKQAEAVVARGVDAVVLVSRWLLYTSDVDTGENLVLLSRFGGDESRDEKASREVFESVLAETIAFYREAGIKVVLVQQVPELNVDPRHVVNRAMMLRQSTETAWRFIQEAFTRRSDHENKQAYVRRVFSSMAGPGVTVVSLQDAFAEGAKFIWLADGKALYFDDNHLTVAGARRAEPLLAQELKYVLTGG